VSLNYLSLVQAAKAQPPTRGDKPVSPSTLTRWIRLGVLLSNGTRLRLKAIRYPSGWKTTQEWLAEFVDTLTRASVGVTEAPPIQERPRQPVPRRGDHQPFPNSPRRVDVAPTQTCETWGIPRGVSGPGRC
jgi:hypothetical protein